MVEGLADRDGHLYDLVVDVPDGDELRVRLTVWLQRNRPR